MNIFKSEQTPVEVPRMLGFQLATELTDLEIEAVSGAGRFRANSWSAQKCGSNHCTVQDDGGAD